MQYGKQKFFSGVGSRDAPKEILEILRNLSFNLSKDGWILRSGGADGCDNSFEMGYVDGCVANEQMEIYLPWNGFNGRFYEHGDKYIMGPNMDNWADAKELASKIHPAWDKLSDSVKNLHTRNIYQVLGKDLSTPSKFLVCYAKPQGDSVQGGTRTAWEVAKMHHIPCFNLYDSATLERIQKYLEE